jgi:hypothetical protein
MVGRGGRVSRRISLGRNGGALGRGTAPRPSRRRRARSRRPRAGPRDPPRRPHHDQSPVAERAARRALARRGPRGGARDGRRAPRPRHRRHRPGHRGDPPPAQAPRGPLRPHLGRRRRALHPGLLPRRARRTRTLATRRRGRAPLGLGRGLHPLPRPRRRVGAGSRRRGVAHRGRPPRALRDREGAAPRARHRAPRPRDAPLGRRLPRPPRERHRQRPAGVHLGDEHPAGPLGSAARGHARGAGLRHGVPVGVRVRGARGRTTRCW